jgi:hypothetical protein
MIKTIKKAYNHARGKHVEQLSANSQGILDVFTSTVKGLEALNAEADKHIAAKEAQVQQLATDLTKLNTLKENHGKVIAKISKIFE